LEEEERGNENEESRWELINQQREASQEFLQALFEAENEELFENASIGTAVIFALALFFL